MIFEKSATTYIVKQVVNESNSLTSIRISENMKEIYVGSENSKLLVYRDNGSSFILDQTINIGFRAVYIHQIPNKLEVNGYS